jgi:iduronate 2-sulfatase
MAFAPSSLLLAQKQERWQKSLTKHVFTSKTHGTLPYRLFQPPSKGQQSLPLVLFLHGADERGTDNKKQLLHGVRDFITPTAQQARPCILLAPQCPEGRWWNVEHFTELLRSALRSLPVDRDRVYITGLSMGGYGTWSAISQTPELFAAAIPICGGGEPDDAKALKGMPIWAFHGDADTDVKPEESREMIAAIQKTGGKPKYTEYPGVQHDSWTRSYANTAVQQWLFQQSRARKSPGKRKNVLFLISDDLGPQSLGCYGNSQCKTPAIDGLAARGVRFTKTYCQFPVCGPSRACLMSGMYPQSIGVMGNGGARQFTANIGDRPTMTGLFKANGWSSLRVSKIYHMRIPGDITAGVHGPDHAESWTERYSVHAPEWFTQGKAYNLTNERLKFQQDKHYNLGFGTAFYVVEGKTDGAEQADVLAADKAIELLGKQGDTPFFLAVGFVRPHVPLVAPAAFYKPYPAAAMKLPAAVENDQDDIPKLGISKTSKRSGLDDDAQKRRVLSAYYASVSFMDSQVARVLQALDDNGLRDNTIVVFTADHGYHLGEHDFWQKLSLHDESARIPLIVSGPGIKTAETPALAQQIDIYPTLAELCGLKIPKHVQGKSLAAVIANPEHEVHQSVYCTNKKGHLLRTGRWAYLSWRDGSAELYDMNQDPQQFTNLAQQEEHAATIAKLSKSLGEKLQTFK